MRALCAEVRCVRTELGSDGAGVLLGSSPREPQVLLLSGEEIALRVTATQVDDLARKASRWRNPERRYRSFRDALVGKVRDALRR
jgi:hypothetical protein